jgi:hypothetical protein
MMNASTQEPTWVSGHYGQQELLPKRRRKFIWFPEVLLKEAAHPARPSRAVGELREFEPLKEDIILDGVH